MTWLVLSCLLTIGNLVYWGPPTSVSSIVFSAVNTVVVFAVLYIVVGIGGGFVREAVRGYRDAPRPTNGPSG